MIKLHLIAAVGKNGAIGLGNRLPWHFPDDLRLFKQLTENSTIIVGKRTNDLLPMLPMRIVEVWDGREEPSDLLHRLELEGSKAAWLCGGSYTYRAFAPYVNGNKIINFVDYNGPYDTQFPFDAYGIPTCLQKQT